MPSPSFCTLARATCRAAPEPDRTEPCERAEQLAGTHSFLRAQPLRVRPSLYRGTCLNMLTICLYKMQCGKPTRGPDISLLDGRRLDAHDATDRTGPGAAGGPGRERTDRTVVCTCASCGHDRAGVPGIRLRDTAAGRLRPPFGIRRPRARPRTLHAFAIESAIGAPRTPLLPALRPECPPPKTPCSVHHS